MIGEREPASAEQRASELEQLRAEVSDGISEAIVVLRGSVEFRNAVEALLLGTPYAKPPDSAYDFEGLYGRIRSALGSASSSSLDVSQVEALIATWRMKTPSYSTWDDAADDLAALLRGAQK